MKDMQPKRLEQILDDPNKRERLEEFVARNPDKEPKIVKRIGELLGPPIQPQTHAPRL